MNFFARVRNAVNAFNNTGTLNDENFWTPIFKGKTEYLSEITYFTCLKTMSEAVAKLPLKLYKETKNGIVKATDLPLYNTLKLRPNPNMTSTVFWAAVQAIKYHYGNAYVYPYYSSPTAAPEMFILDNNHMSVYSDNACIISPKAQVWYIYIEPTTGKVWKIPQSDILHFKTYMSFDGITGLAVKDILSATVGGALDGQKFVNNLYENGLTGKIAVEYTGDLNEGHKKRLVKILEGAIDAEKALNFIPVPDGIKLNPLNLKLTDAQFLEIRKYTSLQIAGAFGIKPNQLNDYEKSSYANSEQQQQAFLTDTMLVDLKGTEEELTTKLLSKEQIQEGYFFKFNVDVILRATFTERMEGYAKARQNGWLSANDIRLKEDMPLIPDTEGGNAYLVNGNMVPITTAMKGGEK